MFHSCDIYNELTFLLMKEYVKRKIGHNKTRTTHVCGREKHHSVYILNKGTI